MVNYHDKKYNSIIFNKNNYRNKSLSPTKAKNGMRNGTSTQRMNYIRREEFT